MRRLIVLLLLLAASDAFADELLMARSREAFPEAMLRLQNSIRDHGYTVSRVQRVDVGLTENGFATDKYRVVFFGKPGEVRDLAAREPGLIPYLPLQMTVFEEGDETVVVVADPLMLRKVATRQETAWLLERWNGDLHSILDDLRQ